MIRFFHSPGSCSNGILLLLEEAGAQYEIQVVDVLKGDQHEQHYLEQNSKGKVPAIRTDEGTVVTEFPAIAYWVANNFPQSGLWPQDVMSQVRTLEALDFIVSSVHMRGFTFLKMPQKFIEDPSTHDSLRDHGRREINKGLVVLSEMMGDGPYLLGKFGIADGALFYVLSWCELAAIDMPENLAAALAHLRNRVTVKDISAHLSRDAGVGGRDEA